MTASGESLYEGVCKETKNPDCLPLLKDDPRITTAKNYLDLSRFILDFAENKAREGQKVMLQIAKEHPTVRINLCANHFYEGTITSFISAKGELIEDPMTATYDAKVAGDGPEYCAEAFTAANLENPPINKLVALVSIIAFYATDHLD
ncbi:hypothetical protein TanjilG_24398 [Lupinus angustifolius]|uniref:Pectinesterase inhibitor domain-containing protein n=1 Tax=Lupinus angustifolius TaxID=3871 RepID=A0A1J7FMU8_LUPAN|nr:PREDICTED: uncharacterized protein LOC109341543 [Lupinus angustifolius]OIV89230.1 hypothetical protein TanjilG_24398 [Lupinus angustifolius]